MIAIPPRTDVTGRDNGSVLKNHFGSNGTIVFNANGSYAYTPTTGYLGRDSIHYQVCDLGTPALCRTAVLFITIVDPLCSTQLSLTSLMKIDFGTGARTDLPSVVSGATTDQIYAPTGGVNDDYYTIANNANVAGAWAQNIPDHTTGDATGRLMVINAAHQDTIEFFRLPITGLCPGTRYQFSAWIRNISNAADLPNVSFDIKNGSNDVILSSVGTGDIAYGAWYQHGFTFTTGAESSINLVLRNNLPRGGNGNDLVIDDIEFTHCGPNLTATVVSPSATTICAGGSTTITSTILAGYYVTPQYQWQLSTDAGANWNSIAGATTTSYTISAATASMNGYQYRLTASENGNIAKPSCRVTSNPITLTQVR